MVILNMRFKEISVQVKEGLIRLKNLNSVRAKTKNQCSNHLVQAQK